MMKAAVFCAVVFVLVLVLVLSRARGLVVCSKRNMCQEVIEFLCFYAIMIQIHT